MMAVGVEYGREPSQGSLVTGRPMLLGARSSRWFVGFTKLLRLLTFLLWVLNGHRMLPAGSRQRIWQQLIL